MAQRLANLTKLFLELRQYAEAAFVGERTALAVQATPPTQQKVVWAASFECCQNCSDKRNGKSKGLTLIVVNGSPRFITAQVQTQQMGVKMVKLEPWGVFTTVPPTSTTFAV